MSSFVGISLSNKYYPVEKYADSSLSDDPNTDPQVRGDAFKTLFVARLSYDVTESDLEREFGRYGPIERV